MAVSTIKRTQKIVSATLTGNTGGAGTVNISAVVSSNDLVLDVACPNYTNALCIPWVYNNQTWYLKVINWQNMSAITNTDLNFVIKYIPNGRVQ